MKEHIHTIPVIDGFKKEGCPFCNMRAQLEAGSIEYMLGPAYMEDDVRMQTNAQGFCAAHYAKLFAGRNRLGLGLMLESHLQQLTRDMPKLSYKAGRFGSPPLEEYITELELGCYICNRVDSLFILYIDTFFHLWKKGELTERVENCQGFCIPHFRMLLHMARKKLGRNDCERFNKTITEIELKLLNRLEADVGWFVKRFDYRFASAPAQADGKNAEQALERCIAALVGHNDPGDA